MDSAADDQKAQALLALLERAVAGSGLRVALIGGMAVNFWEEPRYTGDIDLVVAADAAGIRLLVDALTVDGFVYRRQQAMDEPSGPDFVRMQHPTRGDFVDMQTAKTEYQDLILTRALRTHAEQVIPVASPEDLIVLKLIAHRLKDKRDVDLLAVRDGIDWAYIAHWANIWGVSDRLADLRLAMEREQASRA